MAPLNSRHERYQQHAITRAFERYGLKLTTEDLRALALMCAEGRGRLAKLPNGSERHLVEYCKIPMVVVYQPYLGPSNLASPHKGAGTIVTVLPQEAALAGKAHSSPATRSKSWNARAKAKLAEKRKFKRGNRDGTCL